MNTFKKHQILESIVNNSIDFSKYPNLMKIINYFKGFKMNGKSVITTDDFNYLINKKKTDVREVLEYIENNTITSEPYERVTPAGRAYSVFRELNNRVYNQKSSANSEDKKIYNDAIKDIKNIVASIINYKDPNEQRDSKNVFIDKTKHLKKNNKVIIDNKEYTITDKDLFTFSNKNDVETKKYYDLIIANDFSTKANASSSAAIVYSLYKGLSNACQNTMSTYAQLMDKMGMSIDQTGRSKLKQTNTFKTVNVDQINLDGLHRGATVRLTYKLYTRSNRPFNGKKADYFGDFIYSNLTKNYQFVNKKDKNNSFRFDRPIPQDLVVGKFYNIIYDSIYDNSQHLVMEIVGIGSNSINNFTEFVNCNSVDELRNAVFTIRNR